ncbi:MAG TPA: hypothetical protein VJ866_22675 [Pyrinomonadaceae bacterium]|nr:hypothetical protein [Pyrinomonadaceae bacterium]
MKTRRGFSAALALVLSLAAATFVPLNAVTQAQQYGALERGYRTGYSDGYQSGWTDQLRGASADAKAKAEYRSGDRAYIAAYGSLDDYRDGYQQGFESGYGAGYNRRGFDSELPAGGLQRRGATPRDESAGNGDTRGGAPADASRPADNNDANESASQPRGGGNTQGGAQPQISDAQTQSGPSPVPSNVVLTVELTNRLSTDVSQRGDRFQARVVEPQEFAGAVVAGRLADVQRPGKARGRAFLQLDFEQIQMPGGGDWQPFGAQVVEVLQPEPTGVAQVDEEGGIRGRDSTKDDAVKVGAAAGIGAIIGAIAGGGKGAAIGAVLGGGAASGGVMTQRGKDIRLEPGQQLRIRTTGRR